MSACMMVFTNAHMFLYHLQIHLSVFFKFPLLFAWAMFWYAKISHIKNSLTCAYTLYVSERAHIVYNL